MAITGATGFVGQHVRTAAAARGWPVRALTRQPHTGDDAVQWVTGTLDDADALDQLCAGADALLHIAGAVNVPSRAAFAHANVAGTQAVIDAAKRANIRRFVHVSSLAAREPALSNYGWSKAGAEDAVQQSALDWLIVRPPGVFGSHDKDVLEMFKMARRGFMLLPPAGRGSWIYAPDLAALLLNCVVAGPSGAILEPDDGASATHVDFARAIGVAVDRPNPVTISAPRPLLWLAARADRLVRGDLAKLTPDRARYMAHPNWAADPARAPDPALWQATTPRADALRATHDWYAENGAYG
ncbi:MAG: NAD(P)H-binding protein [Sphingomonadaceae bacterium]|nr:NAD(P)H-binding protein [Sphingomonadaceae bacterium]